MERYLSRPQRAGFTLIELLVVIAIIAVLIGLLVPAVQKVREAANRMTCSNNLKQMAIAMHSYHDANGKFPMNNTGPSASNTTGWSGWHRLSAHYKILPYVEQESLFKQFDLVNASWGALQGGPMQIEVKTFKCPSSNPNQKSPANGWGGPGSNYGWCTGSSVFTAGSANSTNANGIIVFSSENRMADITDGTSNTILAGEMLSGSGSTSPAMFPFDIFYVNDGPFAAIANKAFPTQAEVDTIGNSAKTSPVGSRANNGNLWAWYSHYQSAINTAVTPNWQYPSAGGNCCPGGAHDWGYGLTPPRSQHSGGVNVAMGDGSLKFMRNSVNLLTFQQLGNRKDGAVISTDY